VILTVDPDRCQGHGRCALINSDVFDLNDDGIAVVLDPEPTGSAVADAERAIGNCPEQAIAWASSVEATQHV
jgi:ferredoxin